MSLINDALKRAGRRPTDGGAGGPGGGAPMTPVELSPRPKPNLVLIGLLAACLLAGGYCYLQWKQSKANPTPGQAAQAKAALAKSGTNAAASTAMPKNGILGAAQLIRHTTNLVAQVRTRQAAETTAPPNAASTNAVMAAKTNAPVVVAASPAPAEPAPPVNASPAPSGPFPAVKLQGIFYRLTNPTVLIDGETYKPGDPLAGGVRLVRINRMDIEVEWRGQQKKVPLPEVP